MFHLHGFEVLATSFASLSFEALLLQKTSRAKSVAAMWLHRPSMPAGQPQLALETLP